MARAFEETGGGGGKPSRQSSLSARASHDLLMTSNCSRSVLDFAQAARPRQVAALRRYVSAFDGIDALNIALLFLLQAGAHVSLGRRRLYVSSSTDSA